MNKKFGARLFLAALILSFAASALADLARVGPIDTPSPSGNGFPKWYQDLNGLVLDLCMPDATDPGALQQTACLLETNPPYVFPTNFPDEAFYFRAVSDDLDMSAARDGSLRARLVLALEAAFANGAAAPGDQMVFTRIRVTAGVPHDGRYRVKHPYGTEEFIDVVASGGNRDIVFTEDIGITPLDFAQALKSRVGPFLQRGDASGNATGFVTVNGAQFLSDGVALETVTGSPFGTNYFEICGPFDGVNESCRRTDLFALTGRVHDTVTSPIGSPLKVERATYSRDSTNGARVDVSATAIAGIGEAAPKLSAGAVGLPPVLLDGPNVLGQFYTQGMPVPPSAVPGLVTLTNYADSPPSALTWRIDDVVTVTGATWDPATKVLVVSAKSSDKGYTGATGTFPAPDLSLDGFPTATKDGADPVTFTVANVTVPPASVGVTSSAGGEGRLQVSMLASQVAYSPGVPLARDDTATATAGGAAVTIPVKSNDIHNDAAPIFAEAVSILAPGLSPAIGGLAANANGTVTFAPSTTTGTATFRYTVRNAVGTSNVATVTVNVVPAAGGPVPIANNDPGPGDPAISVNANTSRVIDVLANDSGNGGTLDPATVAITAPTAGTASVNTANGTVTYDAPATVGNYTFTYTVKNTNGNQSAPATVTVSVVAPESISVTRARCTVNSADWDVRGTSTVAAGNTVTVYLAATVPAVPTSSQVLGSAPVDALGNWALRQKGGVGCTTPISLQSTLGTKVNNVSVQVR